MRLSKRMAELGLCSRREADEYISRGLVSVNGVPAVLGQKVTERDRIEMNRVAERDQSRRVTILLHKPLGYVSGQAEDGYRPARVLIRPENCWSGDKSPLRFDLRQLQNLVPAGRLDVNSTGLLVLTQDGRVARRLVGEDSAVEKEYLVRVAGSLSERGLALLNHGLSLDGEELLPARVRWQNDDQLRFVLQQGKNVRSAACALSSGSKCWPSNACASVQCAWGRCRRDSGAICFPKRPFREKNKLLVLTNFIRIIYIE